MNLITCVSHFGLVRIGNTIVDVLVQWNTAKLESKLLWQVCHLSPDHLSRGLDIKNEIGMLMLRN